LFPEPAYPHNGVAPSIEATGLPGFSPKHLAPLVIGVSGHRDLHADAVARARTEVGAFLDQLAQLLPNTPIRIMVGLAEGADMLVAEAALERKLAVDAVLPMPLEDYAMDFSEEGLARLHRLLEHPDVRRIVLSPPAVTVGASDVLSPQPDRVALYANLADALLRKTNLLIALWDGEFSALRAGTADTVVKYLAGHTASPTATRVSFAPESREIPWGQQTIHWICVERTSAPRAEPCTSPCYLSGVGENVLRRQAEMPDEVRTQLMDLDRYNAEIRALQSQGAFSAADALAVDLPAEISGAERSHLQRIDNEYRKADALAVLCQRHSLRLFRWFSYMASAMGLLFLVYAKLVAAKVFLIAYLVIMLVGLGVFYATKSRHWFTKHLAYRVLAETMRIEFYLRLTDADGAVSAEDMLKLAGIDRFAGFSWITNVLKNVRPLTTRHARKLSREDVRLRLVHDTWIDGQLSYFRAKVLQLERTHHRLERLKTALLVALALITVVLLVFAEPLARQLTQAGFSSKDFLMFVMGLLPVWLGIWELYQDKLATRELLWQYRNQLSHFSRAKIELTEALEGARRVAILADLGRDSLMESYLWTIHRYHREHEPPSAG
jgi:hypothetical protein